MVKWQTVEWEVPGSFVLIYLDRYQNRKGILQNEIGDKKTIINQRRHWENLM